MSKIESRYAPPVLDETADCTPAYYLRAVFPLVPTDRKHISCTGAGRSTPPNLLPNLSPAVIDLMRQHFWCDFKDVIPLLSWDGETGAS